MAKKGRSLISPSTTYAVVIIWMYLALRGLRVSAQVTNIEISNVTSSSCTISFSTATNAAYYEVVLIPRNSHRSERITYCASSTRTTISGFRPDVKYDVTIDSVIGSETSTSDETVPLISLPTAPILQFSTPGPTSVFIFFQANNIGQITQWKVEYQEVSPNSTVVTVSSTPAESFSFPISDLTPSTAYQIRGAASQVNGSNIEDNVMTWSTWYVITTDALSVFGRVTLSNVNYTSEHAIEGSSARNESLSILKSAYASTSHAGISIISIEDKEGNPVVHYRLKVEDKSLPSPNNYMISGTNFVDAAINNGDIASGTPYAVVVPYTKITLIYVSSTGCSKIVERFLDVTVEGEPTTPIHLNVASSSATVPEEDDSLVLETTGDSTRFLRDDDLQVGTAPPSRVILLTPRFLVKDCLVEQQSTELYSELMTVTIPAGEPKTHFYWNSAFNTSVFNSSTIWYSDLDNGAISLTVPSVKGAIKYEIINGADTFAACIDSNAFWKVTITGLTQGKYLMQSQVTYLGQNGTEPIVESSKNYTVNANETLCSHCPSSSYCEADVGSDIPVCKCWFGYNLEGGKCVESLDGDREMTCECNSGYTRNNTTCVDIDECTNDTMNNCDTNANCTNKDGSFSCECKSGYKGSGTTCSDIDECTNETLNNCDTNANCTNKNGSFSCECKSGYERSGTTCSDTDECTDNTINNCDSNANCKNGIGTYCCECRSGYVGNGSLCFSIENCSADMSKETGEFNWTCLDEFTGEGVLCLNRDECLNTSHTCILEDTCANTVDNNIRICVTNITKNDKQCFVSEPSQIFSGCSPFCSNISESDICAAASSPMFGIAWIVIVFLQCVIVMLF